MTEFTMVPMHSVFLLRETGKEDAKTKTPIMERISPAVGKPFKFTRDEIDSIKKMSPLALRSPRNESIDFAEEADQAAAAAAANARLTGGAPSDAAGAARSAVAGKGKLKPGSTTETELDETDDL
jgi:hypothetical protein